MRLKFQQKLTLSFLVIFIFFATGIVIFEQKRARGYKAEALTERLDAYGGAVSRFVINSGQNVNLDSLISLLPENLRLTVMDRRGNVWYDNGVSDAAELDNHATRPEIAEAVATGSGSYVRVSASNDIPYLYYAVDDGNRTIVRVALPYDLNVRSFLQPDNAFLYFVIALFLIGLALIYYVGNHFGKSVRALRDFSVSIEGEGHAAEIPDFGNDELGEVGARLAADVNALGQKEIQLRQEREKLLMHIQTSAEGVCFFNPDRTVAFYNGLFLQYYGSITCRTVAMGESMTDAPELGVVSEFLDTRQNEDYFETRIGTEGREFLLRLNIFEDESFEIILTDITAEQKTRRLKHEMTGNIAHELRTPVTSIRGFLEIVLSNNLDETKKRDYLERAFRQTQTLSELISDMSLLTKIDHGAEKLSEEQVDLNKVIEHVKSDTVEGLQRENIRIENNLPQGLTLKGNENLIYSIFRNLTDNVIAHAGTGVQIQIGLAGKSDGFAHLTFSDNGRGIDDRKHIERLFERFYRVGEGRTRDSGGSGLGLAIVKNAVLIHGGQIFVDRGPEGGLQFSLSLPLG